MFFKKLNYNVFQTALKDDLKVGNFYEMGMEELQIEHKYDLIWIQWVIGHLTDDDLVKFLKKCKESLIEKGVILVKDNVCNEIFIVDKNDYSIVRTVEYYRKIYEKADIDILYEDVFKEMPEDLYQVRIFALR